MRSTEDGRVYFYRQVRGVNIPRPVVSFAHFGFDERLMKTLRKSEFSTPTAIQTQVPSRPFVFGRNLMVISLLQAIPAALSGRDIIGIAKTGSGKTGAFVWPAIVHIMAQVNNYLVF
jgi:ATP-dependent RNA helicase DDX42